VATRNETLHEGLFFDEPLGFRTFVSPVAQGVPNCDELMEMRALVCRVICALMGFNDASYITSRLDTRQLFLVRL
jgi:hypothetical protein